MDRRASWLEPIVALIEPRSDVFFLVGEIAGGKLRVAKGDLRLQLRGRAYAPIVARVDPVGIANDLKGLSQAEAELLQKTALAVVKK